MKFSKILFVLFAFILGFSLGVLYGNLTLPKGSGLAGSAIVLGDGLIGALLLLIISIFLVRKLSAGLLKKINIVFSVLVIILIGWSVYRHLTKAPQEKRNDQMPKMETVAPSALLFSNLQKEKNPGSMGMGMCKPKFFEYNVLYFYSNPNLEKSSLEHTPTDSVVFKRGDGFTEITYAPPYFVPEYLKLDYDMLYLKTLTVGLDWIEVEVNKTSGLSSWVNSSPVSFIGWSEFLLKAISLDIIDEESNPLKIKPLDHASIIANAEYEFLIPRFVKGEWVMVELRNELHINNNSTAWVRWTDGKKLLVKINLLS